MNDSSTDLFAALERACEMVAEAVGETLRTDAARGMSDTDVLDVARVAERIGRRIDGLRVIVAGEIGDRSRSERGDARLSAQHGCANPAELIARLTGVSALTARARMLAATAIGTTTALSGEVLPARFAAVRAAVDEGAIGIDSVTAIAQALGAISPRCHPGDLAAAEGELVDAATGGGVDHTPPCTADDTMLQAKVWQLVLDPDGRLPEAERGMRKRGITLGRKRDGLIPLRGGLTPDVAEQFRILVDSQLSPRVVDRTLPAELEHADAARADTPLADSAFIDTGPGPVFRDAADDAADGDDELGPVVPLDTRTRAQKMHDAFAAILGVAARSAESSSIGGAPPTLLVTISADDLASSDGIGFVEGTDTTVPAHVARQIACSGGIQRVIFGDNGRIVRLGAPERIFSGARRRAIVARDGECIIPGCHVPGNWCEVHHVIEHARGGPTHTDNGVLLCWHHHRTLETNGWQIRMVDGVPQTKAPYNIDPYRQWRPVAGSLRRQYESARRRQRQGHTQRQGQRSTTVRQW